MYSARIKKCLPAVLLAILLFVFSTGLAEVHVNEEKPADWNQRELFRITSLNFFQNDVFILECGGKVMLLDGGAQKHWTKYRDFLREHNMTHVDILFNTHPHDDHLDGQIHMLSSGRLTADVFISPFQKDYNNEYQKKMVALLELIHLHRDLLTLPSGSMVIFHKIY